MRLTITVSHVTAFGAFSCCRQEGKTQTPLGVPKSRFICDCRRELCLRLTKLIENIPSSEANGG
jgi:hypothetical protein